jgi:thiol-disulfide isomerase/thioredoxin
MLDATGLHMAGPSIRGVWFAYSSAVVTGALFLVLPAAAQPPDDGDEKSTVQFPSVWVNSEPISAESLQGKAAFLYFFEQRCPRCRDRWPALMETAAKYANEPIVFVAVSSGTTRQDVERYARAVNLTWPVIVDTDRSFERKADVGEISLQNVMQVAYLAGNGELRHGDWSNIDGTIRQALEGAKWNVDPALLPADMHPVWRSIEFGNYVDARPGLTKALASRKNDIKAAAQRLSDFVASKSDRALALAANSASQGHALQAYQRYGTIAERFAGYPAGEKAVAARRELSKQPELNREIVALKRFEKQRELASSSKPAVRDKARAAIQKLVDADPTSEAARLGRELLQKP